MKADQRSHKAAGSIQKADDLLKLAVLIEFKDVRPARYANACLRDKARGKAHCRAMTIGGVAASSRREGLGSITSEVMDSDYLER